MNKVGVHFGMNCVSPDAYDGWSGELEGCWNDATQMAATFATFGYDTQGYFDADCTLDKIRSVFADAAAKLIAGDIFVFSNSGHGSQKLGMFADSEEGLCLYDGILVESEFRYLFAQFKPGVKLVAILDVCHAAGLAKSMPTISRPRVAPVFVTRKMRGFSKSAVPILGTGLVMAACAPGEVSLDGNFDGAFTESLLASQSVGMTWKRWMQDCQRYMSQHFSQQHPEIDVIGQPGLVDEVVIEPAADGSAIVGTA